MLPHVHIQGELGGSSHVGAVPRAEVIVVPQYVEAFCGELLFIGY